MAKKKQQPQNQWSKITYLFVVFAAFVFAIGYFSDILATDIQSGDLAMKNEVFSLTYIQNTGASFSILQDSPFVLIAIAVIALVVLFAYIIRHAGTMSFIGIFWLDLMMSGMFCNLFERVQLGYVRDFINLTFVEFPVFNLADMAISIGGLAVMFLILKRTQLKQL